MKKRVEVTLPVEIVELMDTWAARGDMSRDTLLSNMIRFAAVEAGQSFRILRTVDYEILERNHWHKPKYLLRGTK